MIMSNYITITTPLWWIIYKKESVELNSFIKMEVVVKPESNKRYNAPHLDSMGIGTQNAYSHIAIQEMSAVRYP